MKLQTLTRALPRPSSSIRTPILLPTTRSVSYAPNPQAKRENPNKANKIPPSKRPLARPIVGPPTITEEALKECKWIIRRTSFAQLPVYQKWRQGATRQEITIKGVTGDKRALLQELRDKLDVPEAKIKLNPTTGAIVLTVRSSPTVLCPE